MSSRSFRRRNNRRKHNRPAAGTDSRAPAQQGPVGQDPQKEPGQRSNQGRGPRRENQRQGQPGRNPSGGRRSPPDRARDAAGHVQFPEPPRVYPDCPVCQQQVRELPSALTHRATGQPAHFDCIMRELRDSNELLPQERICYLGGGTFRDNRAAAGTRKVCRQETNPVRGKGSRPGVEETSPDPALKPRERATSKISARPEPAAPSP